MRGMKTALIFVALALLACLVLLRSQPDEPVAASAPDASRGPSFEVHVVKPLANRPLFGLFGLLPAEDLGFGQASRGAAIGRVGRDRLELRAEGGWDLSLATDGQGRVAPATRLVFPLTLGERRVTLRCRPADRAVGYLRTAERPGTGRLDGRFLVELSRCQNAESGKNIEWPSRPLTVRGSFAGLPKGRR
jgi:hypothetical protein